jgi:hypothetical protein
MPWLRNIQGNSRSTPKIFGLLRTSRLRTRRDWTVWKANRLLSCAKQAVVAQLVERVLGKDEVTGSIPVNGSTSIQDRDFGSYYCSTAKFLSLSVVPPALVTAIGPVVAPSGTVARMLPVFSTLKLALTRLKVTAVTPTK